MTRGAMVVASQGNVDIVGYRTFDIYDGSVWRVMWLRTVSMYLVVGREMFLPCDNLASSDHEIRVEMKNKRKRDEGFLNPFLPKAQQSFDVLVDMFVGLSCCWFDFHLVGHRIAPR